MKSKTVTKASLSSAIESEIGYTKKFAKGLSDSVFSLLTELLLKGRSVNISGFGKFEVLHKKARRGRNPQTRAAIVIAKRKSVSFHPSAVLKKKFDKAGKAKAK